MTKDEKLKVGVIVGGVVIVVLFFLLHGKTVAQSAPADQPQEAAPLDGGPLPVMGFDVSLPPGITALFSLPGLPPNSPIGFNILGGGPPISMGDINLEFNIPSLPELVYNGTNLPNGPSINLWRNVFDGPTIVLDQVAPADCGTPCGCGGAEELVASTSDWDDRVVGRFPDYPAQYQAQVAGLATGTVAQYMNGAAAPRTVH